MLFASGSALMNRGSSRQFHVVLVLMSGLSCPASAQLAPTPVPLDGYFMAPVWSPDGTELAVTTAGYKGIYVTRPDGTAFRQVTSDDAAGYRFSWSPDGRSIAFRSRALTEAGLCNSIKLVNTHSLSVQLLVQQYEDLGPPTFLADGSIRFASARGIFLLNRTGGVQPCLPVDGAFVLSWPANGSRVAYCRQDKLVVADVAGNIRLLSDSKDGRLYAPVLSPDGKRLVVHRLDGSMLLVEIASGRKVELGEGYAASWSPDGTHILCNVSKDDGHQILTSDLYLIRVADGHRIRLTATPEVLEAYASWAPDGARIAYGDIRTGTIYVAVLPDYKSR